MVGIGVDFLGWDLKELDLGKLIFVFWVTDWNLGLLGVFQVTPKGVTVDIVDYDDVFVVGSELFYCFDHFLATGTFFGMVEDAGKGVD